MNIFTVNKNVEKFFFRNLFPFHSYRSERSRRRHDFSEEHDQSSEIRNRILQNDVGVTASVTRQRKTVTHLKNASHPIFGIF
jgi:hypothetical protein